MALTVSTAAQVLDDLARLVERAEQAERVAARWRRSAVDLDAENDELRRENERLLKAIAAPATQRSPGDASELCCGGTTVRAVCAFHGPQAQRASGPNGACP
jgi:hypothetical protein